MSVIFDFKFCGLVVQILGFVGEEYVGFSWGGQGVFGQGKGREKGLGVFVGGLWLVVCGIEIFVELVWDQNVVFFGSFEERMQLGYLV